MGDTRATLLKSGTYTLKKTNTDDLFIFAALYVQEKGYSRIEKLYNLTESSTFDVTLLTGKKYNLKLFCLKNIISMQIKPSNITITNWR